MLCVVGVNASRTFVQFMVNIRITTQPVLFYPEVRVFFCVFVIKPAFTIGNFTFC